VLAPLMPVHSIVGLKPSAEHVNISPASYGAPSDGLMITSGGQSADRVVFVLQISASVMLTLPSLVIIV